MIQVLQRFHVVLFSLFHILLFSPHFFMRFLLFRFLLFGYLSRMFKTQAVAHEIHRLKIVKLHLGRLRFCIVQMP